VERHTRLNLGISLDDLPELPLRDGFELGETPAEFYVGAVLYLAESLGYQEQHPPTS
jgi:hypothetical protein